MPTYRFNVRDADGGDLGEVTYTFEPQVGEKIILQGNVSARVTTVIPAALIEEFGPNAMYGLLEVTVQAPARLYEPKVPPGDGTIIR